MANGKALLGIGIGVGIIGLLAFAGNAQSNVVVNRGPAPLPPRRPGAPPVRRPGDLGPAPGSVAADAIAAAVAAAQGAGAGGGGGVQPASPPGGGMLSGLLLPNPAPLVQGQRYKARLELTGLQAYGSRAKIKSTFEDLGFANATVYMTQAELPTGWPGLALANVTSGSRWAEGTWNQTSQSVATPPQIKNAWTA